MGKKYPERKKRENTYSYINKQVITKEWNDIAHIVFIQAARMKNGNQWCNIPTVQLKALSVTTRIKPYHCKNAT